MTGIELWSTTASSNNSAAPNGWPEGMPPSGVNDSGRQMMAATREWYETAEWINLGYTPTYIGATSFSLVGDKTADFQVGRRIKAFGTTPFTIYGVIATSAYTSLTTVTVTWDSGTLNSTLTKVWISINSVTNKSISASMISGLSSGVPFDDSNALIKGSSDATKLARFEVDGNTTGTTRVYTLQNRNGTLADDTDLALKANLASPAFTGTPSLPTGTTGVTQTALDNSTKLATTAHVKLAIATPNFYQATPSNPTATTSAVGVMMGLAGAFTPSASGSVLIIISGDLANSSSSTLNAQIRYGTGTAPVNGAALTGTAVGAKTALSQTGAASCPFSLNCIVTGLTLSTAIWIDSSLTTNTGTASMTNISISVYELK